MSDDTIVTSYATNTVTIGSFKGSSQTTEYTLSDVDTAYKNAVLTIDAILHGTSSSPTTPPTLDAAAATSLSNQVTLLRNLLLKGITSPVDPTQPDGIQKTYYMTTEMADQVTILFKALQLLGVTIPNDATSPVTITLGQAQLLQEIDSASLLLNGLFTFALSSDNTRSVQSLVELDYIKTANDILSDQLSSLEQALEATKSTLDYLGNLQEIHNQIVISNSTSFANKFNIFASAGTFGSPSAFLSAYNKAASTFFSPPITPSTKLIPDNSAYATITVPTGGAALLNDTTIVKERFFALRTDLLGMPTIPDSTGSIITAEKQSNGKYTLKDSNFTTLSTDVDINIGDGGINGKDKYVFLAPHSYSDTFRTAYDLQTRGSDHSDGYNVSFTFNGGGTQSASFLYSYEDTTSSTLNASNLVIDRIRMQTIGSNFQSLNSDILAVTNAGDANISIAVGWFASTFLNRLVVNSGGLTSGQFQTALNNLGVPTSQQYVFASIGTPTPLPVNVPGTFAAGQGVWIAFLNGFYTVDTNPNHTISGFVRLKNQLVDVRNQLIKQLHYLSGATPRINVTPSNPLGDEDPNALVGRLRKVVDDLNATLVTAGGVPITASTSINDSYIGIRKWLLDNYDKQQTSANLSGAFQQNINFAITAGQSRKDTETQKVQRFLYVFEEYYKSASAVLQQLTQILERMAQGIAR